MLVIVPAWPPAPQLPDWVTWGGFLSPLHDLTPEARQVFLEPFYV